MRHHAGVGGLQCRGNLTYALTLVCAHERRNGFTGALLFNGITAEPRFGAYAWQVRSVLEQQHLELWDGFACSVVRVGHSFRDLIRETGHADRTGDLTQLKSLGITKLRYPVLWETIA